MVRSKPDDPWSGRLSKAALVVAFVPLVVAAVRAVNRAWVPVGDSAIIAIRTHDVFGGEVPLLGLWASASWTLGFDVNHPGPLLFDVLAVPAALFGGGGAGMVVANTILNGLALLGIAVVAHRRGGPLLATAATATGAALSWSMGSEVLVEPWHAHSILLPFLFFLLLVWSVTRADLPCLPWAFGVGSLVIQTNLTYAVMVPALLIWAVGGLVLEVRRSGHVPDRGPVEHAPLLRSALVSAVVLAVSWAQPLIEQVSGEGDGNLTRLVRGLGESPEGMGSSQAVQMVAKVVALPPWWFRPSFSGAFPLAAFGNPLPALGLAVAALAVLSAVLVGCALDARRRDDRESLSAVMTGALLVGLGLLTATQSPTSRYGTIAYQTRWLWPLASFVTLAVATAFVRRWTQPGGRVGPLVGVFALATVVVAVVNLPMSNQGTVIASTLPASRDVLSQLDDLDLPAAPLVECFEGVFDPYCEAVMAHLQTRNVDFVVKGGDVGVRQLGGDREFDGTNADSTLAVITGDFAVFPQEGTQRLALHEGLDKDDQYELFVIREQLKEYVGDGRLRLNDRGRMVRDRGDLPSLEGGTNVEAVFGLRPSLFGERRRDMVVLVRERLLQIDDDVAPKLERYADLQERWDNETVAVFVDRVAPQGEGS